jgi:hypothetical protein
VDGAGSNDERTFDSDYLIKPSVVDKFADDGVTRSGSRTAAPTDEIPCTDKWVAASATTKNITGPFIGACRHGLIETLVEMRCSGEL